MNMILKQGQHNEFLIIYRYLFHIMNYMYLHFTKGNKSNTNKNDN